MNQCALTDLCFFLLVLYTALLSSLVLIPLSTKLAVAAGLLDHPDSRKVHLHALPRLGGRPHRAVRRARPARCYDVLVHHNMGVDGDGSNFRSAWYHKYR